MAVHEGCMTFKDVYTLDVDLAPTMDADNDGEADNDLTAKSVGNNLPAGDGDEADLSKLIKAAMPSSRHRRRIPLLLSTIS